MKVLPGRRSPLGATWDGEGVNFAVFSEHATAVEVCLFDAENPARETARLRLREVTAHVWHGYVRGLGPGQLYGFRLDGPYEPQHGLRFNPFKLLLDPYARAVAGNVDWKHPVFGYPLGNPDGDLAGRDEGDSAAGMPKGVVVDPAYDWEGDRPLRTPWYRTVIYEAHVRGLTMRHPDVPPELRGTYAGVAHPAVVEHLKSIGVTAVELLPVHDFVDDSQLLERGLRNYWGYNTLNFFSPDARYSGSGDRGGQVREFRDMVKALHRAGLEVILDVVYNHTAEGNHLGPTLSFKGIDNPTYYRLKDDEPRYYMDYTGTGNSLDTRHPQVLKLVNDSLRYWVQEMHVDGFRFDLAATLAREEHGMDRLSSFFDVIHQDPVLSEVKLIAEPWDIGEYQVGNFPVLWTEWNGRYRDDVRTYWRGDAGSVDELAYRLTGSSDLYGDDGRKAYASINFVTAHDGFTLNDLVSYEEKHNEANGENNGDGEQHNRSLNFGIEGPTDDPGIAAQREKQKRNFLATLLLSQGVPMILGGDEIGRTQGGNNNAYCQDNEISWLDWELDDARRDLLEFTRRVARLRREHPIFRRRKFFQGQKIRGSELKDVRWLRPDGEEMGDADWGTHFVRSFGMLLGGDAMMEWDDEGERVFDDSFLLLFNAAPETVTFVLPGTPTPARWEPVLDTSRPAAAQPEGLHDPGAAVELPGRSMLVLRHVPDDGGTD
ncbi:glycogen debranching protein GlgX [Longimicrobium sp.]|uniref:glycogen debranching protein GlgX n=1 Tax=Longimicrobium sp. TaxID=2029185 RepID=UPI002B5715B4|nr:glycogen debranching protein GlgX [Longimicrobium sp.]HSU17155.1 glycogen debranching protein GlgX [Longimicrobium sp.]